VAWVRQILREASRLVNDIDESQRPSAAANIAGAQARAGDLLGAFATAHSLPKRSDQAMALGSISWAVAHGGNLAWALNIIATSEEGPSKAIALSQIAEQRAEVSDFERALTIARMIRDQLDYRVLTLVRIATKQWKSGNTRGAERTLREALDEVERTQAANPNSEASGAHSMFLMIAVAQAALGDRGGALATIDRVYAIAAKADDSGPREMLLQKLAMAQAQIGEIQAGLETARKMLPGHQRDFAFQVIADQQAQQGDPRGALETAATISDPTWRPVVLRRIAHAQSTSGDAAGALETIDSIQGDVERAEALAEVAFDQAVNVNATAAQTLQLAWEVAKNAQGELPSHVFGEIAVARGILGDMAGALEIVDGMKDARSKVWPLWNLTERMVAAGDARGALDLAEAQDAPEPKAYALLGLAQGLLDQVDAERKKQDGSK